MDVPHHATSSPRTQLRLLVRSRDMVAWEAWWSRHQGDKGLLRKAVQHVRDAGWEEAALTGLRSQVANQNLSPRECMEWWMYSAQNKHPGPLRQTLRDLLSPQATAYFAVCYGHEDLLFAAMAKGASPWASPALWSSYGKHLLSPYSLAGKSSASLRSPAYMDRTSLANLRHLVDHRFSPEVMAWLSQPAPTPELAQADVVFVLRTSPSATQDESWLSISLPLARHPTHHQEWWQAWLTRWPPAPFSTNTISSRLRLLENLMAAGLLLSEPDTSSAPVKTRAQVMMETFKKHHRSYRAEQYSQVEQWLLQRMIASPGSEPEPSRKRRI